MTDAEAAANPTVDGGAGEPEDGIGLCLSGGGYRAMLFHLGTLWRLYETGYLKRLSRISSVSGGSITAGALALAWPKLGSGKTEDFIEHVVRPVRGLAGRTIDVPAILLGIALPGTISDRIAAAYRRHLYGRATLQALPAWPLFVINATSMQTGALWRFTRHYMADYHLGQILRPEIELAKAVAASSAFPPILAPARLPLDPAAFVPDTLADIADPAFRREAVLADGGVYDNLGLETVWKNFRTVLVSDAGAKIVAKAAPRVDWARGSMRIFDLVDNQVRSLRKRQLMASYNAAKGSAEYRDGAYWSIRSDIGHYAAPGILPCPVAATQQLAATPTRLKALPADRQERLINWGYALCDAALRTHVDPQAGPPPAFPYQVGV